MVSPAVSIPIQHFSLSISVVLCYDKEKELISLKIIVCIDKNNGMMFNRRRQSRDRLVIEDLEKHLSGETLWIAPYSEPLFKDSGIHYAVSEDPIAAAGDGYCFLEDRSPAAQLPITEVILYHWNRTYPADLTFDFDMKAFKKQSTANFPGSSHDKITKEIWKK